MFLSLKYVNNLLLVPIKYCSKGLKQNEKNIRMTQMKKIDILKRLRKNNKDQKYIFYFIRDSA